MSDFRKIAQIELNTRDGIRRIALYHGDLSLIPEEHVVDYLVISAFPNSYEPTPSSMMKSLSDRGVFVSRLASRKEHDLRASCGFWISQDLSTSHPQLRARRILCFEPLTIGPPAQVVGEIFRGMFPFLNMQRGSTVATSLLATGDQGWPPDAIFRPLVMAAIEWLQRGLPITELKIVVRSGATAERLAGEMESIRNGLRSVAIDDDVKATYDIFLSYSSNDAAGAELLKVAINESAPNLRLFDFKLEIDVGKSYQTEIDNSIERSRKIVALLSPSYFNSPECKEELQIARLRNKRQHGSVLFPIYWKSLDTDLKLWLQTLNYADCRECDETRLNSAVSHMLR